MTTWDKVGTAGSLFVIIVCLVGLILSPVAELLIARLLPGGGSLPTMRTRITTSLVTGAISAAFAFRFGADATLPALILLAVLGVQLSRIDIERHMLPNAMVLCLLAAGLACLLAATLGGHPWPELVRAMAGAAILFVIYLILAIISPASLGMGDVKLAAAVGLYLGYLGWTQLLYGGLVGFILNGIITLLVVTRHRENPVYEVAHGPSMIAATVGAWLFLS